ncbi:MAG: hypothetical protein F4Y03_14100 [Alphaproteobacteria bacterium]|nr:hypothetical protein [Alphaproteobacteria bacterium]
MISRLATAAIAAAGFAMPLAAADFGVPDLPSDCMRYCAVKEKCAAAPVKNVNWGFPNLFPDREGCEAYCMAVCAPLAPQVAPDALHPECYRGR